MPCPLFARTEADQRTDPTQPVARGAYGLLLDGLEGADHLLVSAAGWPKVSIDQRAGLSGSLRNRLDERRAEVPLDGGGGLVVDRIERSATYTTPDALSVDAIVHPFLAPVGAIFAWWAGREALHAGSFLAAGRAWALVGDKGSGKSSALAWLALQGRQVMSDDLLVVDQGVAFAAPRSIDLRAESAERFGVGDLLPDGGPRERWRLRLDQVPATVPLGGWVELSWGDTVAIEPISPSARFARLAPHRSLLVEPRAPAALLDLAVLPAFRFIRPRDWGALPDAMGRLLDTLESLGLTEGGR